MTKQMQKAKVVNTVNATNEVVYIDATKEGTRYALPVLRGLAREYPGIRYYPCDGTFRITGHGTFTASEIDAGELEDPIQLCRARALKAAVEAL